MGDPTDTVAALVREAAEVHHTVYRITDGADDDWATWYADWLTRLSELPDVLARRPVRSELTCQLVALDAAYAAEAPDEEWASWYAHRLVEHFS